MNLSEKIAVKPKVDAIKPKPQHQLPPIIPDRPLPPSGVIPDPKKKVYCSYWIQNGECNYIQTGCLYKHEIPTDPNVLATLGFAKVPDWYRKHHQTSRKFARKTADDLLCDDFEDQAPSTQQKSNSNATLATPPAHHASPMMPTSSRDEFHYFFQKPLQPQNITSPTQTGLNLSKFAFPAPVERSQTKSTTGQSTLVENSLFGKSKMPELLVSLDEIPQHVQKTGLSVTDSKRSGAKQHVSNVKVGAVQTQSTAPKKKAKGSKRGHVKEKAQRLPN
jgi:hypothetical protein